MVRHKNRYIVIEISENSRKPSDTLKLKPTSLYHAVLQIVQRLHGDFGVAASTAGLVAKYCNEKTRVAVIRCRHGPHRLIASSLPFIKFIEQKDVRVNILYVGATMKHCFKFIKEYQQRKFDEYCVGLKSDEEKEEMRKAVMQLDPMFQMQ